MQNIWIMAARQAAREWYRQRNLQYTDLDDQLVDMIAELLRRIPDAEDYLPPYDD